MLSPPFAIIHLSMRVYKAGWSAPEKYMTRCFKCEQMGLEGKHTNTHFEYMVDLRNAVFKKLADDGVIEEIGNNKIRVCLTDGGAPFK